MIVLNTEPLTHDYTVKEIAEFDTKAAILENFDILNFGVSKSYRKAELAYLLERIFTDNPAYFLNALPEEEQKLISKLAVRPQDEYVEYPVGKRHLMMQKLHLVLTYEAGDMWHIYMPDSIRKSIDKMAERDIKQYPELIEFNRLLEEITEKRTRLYELMDKNMPPLLPGDNLKQFKEEISSIDQFYVEAKKRLKKLEPYLRKNTKLDLTVIHTDISNTEFMLSLAKAEIRHLEQPTIDISSKRQKLSTTKLMTLLDIRKGHPRGLNCDSDREYTDFANRVVKTMRANTESANWSTDYLRTIAVKVTLYFEDLVSELGLWKTFVNKHSQLYGKPLPFFQVDSGYRADYPCQQDVLYLIWDALIGLKEEDLPNPENPGLLSIARDITDLMEGEFEDIAINDDLVDYLHEASYCCDFYELRQMLKWFYFDCYLTSGRFTDYYYEQDIDFFAESLHAGSRDARYGAECMMPFNQDIGPLALQPKEWLALFLEHVGRKQKAEDVRALQCSSIEPFLKVSSDAKSVRFKNWHGEEFSVRRTPMFNCPDKQLKDPEINGSIGAFACYRGEWFLNGLNSWGDITEIWDAYIQDKKIKEGAGVQNYQHLMELSGGSALFYFHDLEELKRFEIKEMGIPEDQYQPPPMKEKVKNIVLFIPSERGSMGLMFNNADSICDPRNPFYDKKVAKKEALNIITCVDGVAGEFVRYAVSHGLLPDAQLNSVFGGDHGRELVQQNLDFLARTLRRQEY